MGEDNAASCLFEEDGDQSDKEAGREDLDVEDPAPEELLGNNS